MPAKTIPADPPAQQATPPGTALEYIDPALVAIGGNYRLAGRDPSALADAELDALLEVDEAFVASVKATGGNFDPVALIRRQPGPADSRPYLVKHGGARRVRGCIRAGTPLLVFVAGDEGDDRAEALARLVSQWRENHDRKATSATADARAIQGMLDLGMTEASVSRALRIKGGKDTIAAARKVAASRTAGAVAEAASLDLIQTAQLADFEAAGDDEAVQEMAAALDDDPAQFEHAAQKLRDSAASRAQRRDVIGKLEADGIPVMEEQQDTWQLRVKHLRDATGERISDEQHASCPGHAAYVAQDYDYEQHAHTWAAVFICTDADANGHSSYNSRIHGSAGQTPSERQAELDAKRRTRAGNAEWRSATKVRCDYITTRIVQLSSVPRDWDVQAFRLAVLACDTYALQYAVSRHHPLASKWLGLAGDGKTDGALLNGDLYKLAALCADASNAKAAVIELVLYLAAAERQGSNPDAWDGSDYGYQNRMTDLARYLKFLESTGYPLAPIEAHIVGGDGKYRPQGLITVRAIDPGDGDSESSGAT